MVAMASQETHPDGKNHAGVRSTQTGQHQGTRGGGHNLRLLHPQHASPTTRVFGTGHRVAVEVPVLRRSARSKVYKTEIC